MNELHNTLDKLNKLLATHNKRNRKIAIGVIIGSLVVIVISMTMIIVNLV